MKKLAMILAVTGLILAVTATAGASILTVGPGQTYTTIQAAVDAAGTDDTINVNAGTYAESVSVSTAGLTLNSTSAHQAVVNGSFSIMNGADNVTVAGFLINPTSWGVDVWQAGNVTVSGNKIVGEGPGGADDGIRYAHSAPSNPGIVTDNVIEDMDLGIYIDHDNAGTFSITGNTVDNARKAIGIGSLSDALIEENDIRNSTVYGIEIFKADVTEVHLNNFTGNATGLYNGDSTAVDAKCNWWGDASGPGAGDVVGLADVSTWLDGEYPGGTCVPEPATLCLVALGGVGLLGRRRRK